jgi:hypothetical protein
MCMRLCDRARTVNGAGNFWRGCTRGIVGPTDSPATFLAYPCLTGDFDRAGLDFPFVVQEIRCLWGTSGTNHEIADHFVLPWTGF